MVLRKEDAVNKTFCGDLNAPESNETKLMNKNGNTNNWQYNQCDFVRLKTVTNTQKLFVL